MSQPRLPNEKTSKQDSAGDDGNDHKWFDFVENVAWKLGGMPFTHAGLLICILLLVVIPVVMIALSFNKSSPGDNSLPPSVVITGDASSMWDSGRAMPREHSEMWAEMQNRFYSDAEQPGLPFGMEVNLYSFSAVDELNDASVVPVEFISRMTNGTPSPSYTSSEDSVSAKSASSVQSDPLVSDVGMTLWDAWEYQVINGRANEVWRNWVPAESWPDDTERWWPYVAAATYDWGGSEQDAQRMLAIMWCESRGQPNLIYDGHPWASGLLQHLPYYWDDRAAAAGWPGAPILDPAANIYVGMYYALVAPDGGWIRWVCTGGYR